MNFSPLLRSGEFSELVLLLFCEQICAFARMRDLPNFVFIAQAYRIHLNFTVLQSNYALALKGIGRWPSMEISMLPSTSTCGPRSNRRSVLTHVLTTAVQSTACVFYDGSCYTSKVTLMVD